MTCMPYCTSIELQISHLVGSPILENPLTNTYIWRPELPIDWVMVVLNLGSCRSEL